MANKIALKLEIDDKGQLKVTSKNADAAAKSTDKLAQAQTRASASASENTKRQKGVAQAGMNGTKAFSKMQMGMEGGLVPAYAALASHVFALTAAFGVLQRAAAFNLLEQGLIAVGSAAGQNLPAVAQGLKQITGAAISTEQAMRATALATSAGFSTQQLNDLAKVARGASVALGRDMGDALDRLVRGTAKLEPEILDELGIMVRLDDAVADYATELGKAANSLTQFERRQAFLNATTEQGLEKFGALAEVINVNPYDKLSASLSEGLQTGLEKLNNKLVPLIERLSATPEALIGVLILLGSVVAKTVLPSISDAAKAAKDTADFIGKKSVEAVTKADDKVKKISKGMGADTFKNASESVKKYETKIRSGTATLAELNIAEKKVDASIKTRAANIAKGGLKNEQVKKQELLNLELLKKKIQEVAAAERLKGAASVAASKASVAGSQAAAAASTLNAVATGSTATAFAAVGTGIAAQTTAAFGATGVIKKLGGAFTGLFNIVKSVGALLLRFSGFIGIATTGFFMYQEKIVGALRSLGLFSEEVEKSLLISLDFSDVNTSLERSLASTDNTTKKYIMTLRVQAGVLGQVKQALLDLVEARKKANSEEVQAAEKALATATELANKSNDLMERGRTASNMITGTFLFIASVFNSAKDATAELLTGTNDLEEATKNLAEAQQQQKAGDREEGIQQLKNAIAAIESQDALKKNSTEILDILNLRLQQFERGTISTLEEVAAIIGVAETSAAKILSSVDSAAGGFAEFRKSVGDLAQTNRGPFAKVIDNLKGMQSEIKSLLDSGDPLIAYFEQLGDKGKELLDRVRAINPEFAKLSDPAAFNKLVEQIEKVSKAIATSAEEQKRLNELASRQKALGRENAAMLELSLKTQNKAKRVRIETIDQIIKSNNLLGTATEQEKQITELKEEKKTLENSMTKTGVQQGEIALARIQSEQKLLSIFTRQQQASVTMLNNEIRRAEMTQERAFLEGGNQQGAVANLALHNKTLETRKAVAAIEFNMTVKQVAMQHKLLTAQMTLAKLQAEQAGASVKDLAIYDEVIQMSADAMSSTIQAGADTLSLQLEGLELNTEKLTDKIKQQVLEGIKSGSTSGAQQLFDLVEQGAFGGGAGAGIGQLLTSDDLSDKVEGLKAVLAPAMESLAELGPDGEMLNGVIGGAIAIADAYTMMGSNIQKAGDSMGANAAQAQFAASSLSAVGDMMTAKSAAQVAGIDKEIAAEKRRDGKSKDSLAKIAALEKKKETMERKAFAKNKKVQMAVTVANTAASMMAAVAAPPIGLGPLAGIPLAVAMGAMGALQLATISGTSYSGGSSSAGEGTVPKAISVGSRSNSVDLASSNSASGELAYLRGQSGTGNAENFRPAFSGARYRAAGGATTGFVVGEQGPELFVPETPGTIVPNDEAGQGRPMSVEFNISAVDGASVENLLLDQRGSIISMLREAANSYGEDFFETVDTGDYTPASTGARSY